eukprot:5694953-Pyramimonas_sp.AAC.1
MITRKRHLIAVLRKSDECQCGCRGWCSIYPLLKGIAWQLGAMAAGKRPDRMHNDMAWPDGQAPPEPELGFTACVLYIKGDWCEHARTLGLASWAQGHNPCQYCELGKSELHSCAHQLGPDCPWPLRDDGDYERIVAACEVQVLLASRDHVDAVLSAL